MLINILFLKDKSKRYNLFVENGELKQNVYKDFMSENYSILFLKDRSKSSVLYLKRISCLFTENGELKQNVDK